MMINVLHVIDTTGPGGAETVFVNLIAKIDKQRFRSYALIRGEGWVAEQLRAAGIEPIFIDMKGSFSLSYLGGLLSHIRNLKIRIIQSHLFGSNVYCCMAGIIANVPVVATFHGDIDIARGDRTRLLKNIILNWGATRIVFVSNRLKNEFVSSQNYRLNKCLVIYNGVDLRRFSRLRDSSIRDSLGIASNDVVVGSIGNIRRTKGYDVLLHAAAMVKNEASNMKFIVAGDGSGSLMQSVIRLHKELSLESTVFFIGFRNDPEVVLNNVDLFLLPSTSEGFSISTIEAMACGVPVVVTRSGGPEEIVDNNRNGILVDVNSVVKMADALVQLAVDEGRRRKLAEEALGDVREKFSLASMVSAYEILYDSVIR